MKKDFYQIRRIFEEEYDSPLLTFCQEVAKAENKKEWKALKEFFEGIFKRERKDIGADFQTLANSFTNLGFGVGFIFGQMFQPTAKEAKSTVNELKRRLINEDLLRYEPHEEAQRT
jgi:hypothetical protein